MKGLNCKKLCVPLAIMLISMILIAGCGGSSSTTTSSATQTSAAPTTTTSATPAATQTSVAPTTTSATPTATSASPIYGGKVARGFVGSPVNLGHPGKRSGSFDLSMGGPCVETLLDSNFGTYVPRLAESWEIAKDGKSVLFHIREGVKFHDGTTLNAAAVKLNFDAVRAVGELTSSTSQTIISEDVVDEYTVRFNLTGFNWNFLSMLATSSTARIVSAKALTENTPEQLVFNPVGTGPFKFVSYQKDTLVKYTRFDDYWQEGKPYLEAVDAKFFADATTANMAMKAGEIDIMTVTAEEMLDLKADGFNILTAIGKNFTISPSGANADSPLSDVRVRKAISHAIDRKTLADSLGHGYYTPTYQLYGEWSPMGYNPNVEGQPYDPAKAKQLLAEAGYPNGFKTAIIIGFPATDLQIAIQDMLAEVSIEAEIQEMTRAKAGELNWSGWEGMMMNETPLGEGHQDPVGVYGGATLGTGGNASLLKPKDLMDLLEQSKSEQDLDKRKDIFQKIAKGVTDDYCLAIHVYITTTFYAVSPSVHLPELDSFWNTMGKMEDVYRTK